MTDNIEVLTRRRLALVEQRDSIDAQIKAVDAALIDAVEIGGTIDLDGEAVYRVAQRRTFSVDKAREIVPQGLIDAATVPTLDVKALRRLLPEAVTDACFVEGATYVTAVRR